ncbi:cell wall-active antibiotics response protein [Salinispirillum sp. LH 10-3-1]|uniref:Cell wall-active antibiotics response protein n=1 Tax=Salinispirillum sp. LH 10-3-1 TaxID=2952525 RepID=A0AB38YEL4_9GAMM
MSRQLFGALLLGLGGLFLLNALEVINVWSLVKHWGPVLVIVVGIISLMNNPKAFIFPAAIIAFGFLLLLSSLGWVQVSIGSLILPLLFIGFGLSLLLKRSGFKANKVAQDELNTVAVFSGVELNNVAKNFKGGTVSAVFGGAEIDLRKSKLEGEATIELFVAFGGVELKVPQEWSVHVSGIPLFGGLEDKTSKPELDDAPRLNIKGTCVFGGIEIGN